MLVMEVPASFLHKDSCRFMAVVAIYNPSNISTFWLYNTFLQASLESTDMVDTFNINQMFLMVLSSILTLKASKS